MESTVSVSKGVFVFKNGLKPVTRKSKKKSKPTESLFSESLWYHTYKSLWNLIETKINQLNNDMFSKVLSNLIQYVKKCYENNVTEIPAAALLTGVNMPDHFAQFKTLRKQLQQYVTPHVATLEGGDCQNVKYLVENMINQLVTHNESHSIDEDDSDNETRRIKKSQCNFSLLQSWYEEQYSVNLNNSPTKKQKTKMNKKVIVVIIPDFEGFSHKVLQDFILISSTYINVLPFVFILGVATSLTAVHRALPYHVSSKVNIQVFKSSPSIIHLNNVIENVLFSSECPFHLGSKVFNLFTDIFLFYDLSVSGFIQNFKYAMLEHFSYGNAMALCKMTKIKKVLEDFTHDDCENVRRLFSFRRFVENESPENRIHLLTDDNYFKKILPKEIKKITKYITNLHLFIKCLLILVHDLPKAPLGKQERELYSFVVSTNIIKSQEYKECFQLLLFQSKDELTNKIKNITELLANNIDSSKWDESEIVDMIGQLNGYLKRLENLDFEQDEEMEAEEAIVGHLDRRQLKEKLLSMSKQNKPMNKYEKLRRLILDYIYEQFEKHLLEPNNFTFHEIFFFNDISVKNHIIGSHRAAIHTALNDPRDYLECSCCEIANDSIIVPSMPDISIVYKLHLECGKMINLYDWLQSFLSIVDPQELDEDAKPKVQPQLQARFTQAVAELEFLGFIKSSKRKTDHVTRLTWGG